MYPLLLCVVQSALALRPKDADLALAAAQALIAAHNYNRAIDYYNRCA
jgi:thioredoxin-like negative regulator of GroEL